MKMRKAVTAADIKQAIYLNACAKASVYYEEYLDKQAHPRPVQHHVISVWK